MLLSLDSEFRPTPRAHGLQVAFARTPGEVESAQRLRHAVFVEEMGASTPCRRPGIEEDMFDPWCEHLIVRDQVSDEVVGTSRVLTPQRARRLGTYYAETEFDLTRLQLLRDDVCEVGRACIHPDYRNGAVIARLWQGIALLMLEYRYRFLIGCASMGMADGGAAARRRARSPTMSCRPTSRLSSTASSRGPHSPPLTPMTTGPSTLRQRSCRRCCGPTCGSGRGWAETPPGIPISIRRTSSCSCRSPG